MASTLLRQDILSENELKWFKRNDLPSIMSIWNFDYNLCAASLFRIA